MKKKNNNEPRDEVIKIDKAYFLSRLNELVALNFSNRTGRLINPANIKINILENPRRKRKYLVDPRFIESTGELILNIEIPSVFERELNRERDLIIPILGELAGKSREEIYEIQNKFDIDCLNETKFIDIIKKNNHEDVEKMYSEVNKEVFEGVLPGIKQIRIIESEYLKRPMVQKYDFYYIIHLPQGALLFGSYGKIKRQLIIALVYFARYLENGEIFPNENDPRLKEIVDYVIWLVEKQYLESQISESELAEYVRRKKPNEKDIYDTLKGGLDSYESFHGKMPEPNQVRETLRAHNRKKPVIKGWPLNFPGIRQEK